MSSYGGYPVTSPYGPRNIGDGFHDGIDVACPAGTPLYVPWKAKLTRRNHSIYGWMYDAEEVGGKSSLRFAHLSRRYFDDGAVVPGGTRIAKSGGARGTPGAGNSTGAHLHLELRRDGGLRDPEKFPRLVEAVFEEGMIVTKDEVRDLMEIELGQLCRRLARRLDVEAADSTGDPKRILLKIAAAMKHVGDATLSDGRD